MSLEDHIERHERLEAAARQAVHDHVDDNREDYVAALRAGVRDAIREWIEDNRDAVLSEIAQASRS